MRLPGQHTRVRRDGTQGRGRDAADRTSVPRRATWQVPNRADAAQIGPTRSVSAGIGRYRPVSAGIDRIGRYRPKRTDLGRNSKKKKKKVQNAPFDLT